MTAAEPSKRWLWPAVAALVLSWGAAMVWLMWARFEAGFHYEFEDDALAHQMLWAVGEGHFPFNTVHPLHRPSHLEPVFIVLWPLYAGLSALVGAWPAVWTLKAALLGGGAFVVTALGRHERLSSASCLLWAAVFLAAPATIGLVLSTFRPVALVGTAVLALVWALRARRFGPFVLAMLVTLSFREDLALAIGPLAAVAAWRRLPMRFTLASALIPAAWYVVATQWILPAILPARYEDIIFAANVGDSVLARLVDPTHVLGLVALMAPTLGLPLLAAESVVGLTSVGALMVFKGGFAGNVMHFLGPGLGAVFAGALIAHGRFAARFGVLVPAAALAVTVGLHVVPTGAAVVATDCTHNGPAERPGLCDAWSPFDPWFVTPEAGEAARAHAVEQVPADTSVAVVGHLLPRFTPRRTLWEYGHADVPFAEADFLVLEDRDRYSGAGRYLALAPGDVRAQWPVLREAYEVAWSEGAVVVLRRVRQVEGLTDRVRPLLRTHDAPNALKRGVRSPGEERRGRGPEANAPGT